MTGPDTALEPFDSTDEALLRELREIAARLDPAPADLTDRVLFALTVQALEAEVAELTSQAGLVSRSLPGDPTETTTVTFSTEGLSIMVTVTPVRGGRVRLDGWLTCGRAEVELDLAGTGTRTVAADEDGRFVLDDLPHGGARLLVRPPAGQAVVTPQFTI